MLSSKVHLQQATHLIISPYTCHSSSDCSVKLPRVVSSRLKQDVQPLGFSLPPLFFSQELSKPTHIASAEHPIHALLPFVVILTSTCQRFPHSQQGPHSPRAAALKIAAHPAGAWPALQSGSDDPVWSISEAPPEPRQGLGGRSSLGGVAPVRMHVRPGRMLLGRSDAAARLPQGAPTEAGRPLQARQDLSNLE